MICERCGTVFCWDEADSTFNSGDRKKYCSKTCKTKGPVPEPVLSYREQRQLEACTAKGKKPYPSIVAAKSIAVRLFTLHGWRLYPYRCVCGMWHLTSQEQDTPAEFEWFKVFEGESPAFKNWLARAAALGS